MARAARFRHNMPVSVTPADAREPRHARNQGAVLGLAGHRPAAACRSPGRQARRAGDRQFKLRPRAAAAEPGERRHRRRRAVPQCRLRRGRGPKQHGRQCDAPRVPEPFRHRAHVRHCGRLLRRPRHRGRWRELSAADRRGAGARSRRRRRGHLDRAHCAHSRAGQAAAADHSRRLPRQSVRQQDEAGQRHPFDRPRPRPSRAAIVRHADRVRRQGRLDRR